MHQSTFKAVVLGLPFALSLACGSSEPRHAWDKTIIPGTGPMAGISNTNGSDPSRAAAYVPPTDLGCSSRAQQILILDFRSGWWAGGGGGDFAPKALTAVVGACPATSVDYHHFETKSHIKCVYSAQSGGGCQDLQPAVTADDIRKSFELKAAADYTQLWILSGSDQDASDLPVGDSLFQAVVEDTKGACIPTLIAAGDGYVSHANTLTTDFGLGNVFTSKTNPPGFFMAALQQVAMTSEIQAPGLSGHLLFKEVPSVSDHVKSMLQQARGDTMAIAVPEPHIYQVIAKDADGAPIVAVGAAKVAGDGYRPFVFDSGWQRMYTIPSHPGTAQYLKNLVMYMGLVGCKAAPIGPPK
jgi:hypothetical protein